MRRISTLIAICLLAVSFASGQGLTMADGSQVAGTATVNQVVTPLQSTTTTVASPFFDDFEDATTITSLWSTVSSGNYVWQRTSGTTPSTATGPNDDFSGGGFYMFTEASSGVSGDSTLFISPCVDLTGTVNPELDFYYHIYGSDIGRLDVIVLPTGGTPDTVFTQIGEVQTANADPWLNFNQDLTAYAGQTITVIFAGVRGGSFNGDIAIDEVFIGESSDLDLEVISLNEPTGGICYGAPVPMSFDILNVGILDVDFADSTLNYTVDVTGPLNQSFSGTVNMGNLLVGDTLTITVNGNVDLSAGGIYTFTIAASTQGDNNPNNDTLAVQVNSVPTFSFPYCEDFETFVPGNPGTFANGWQNLASNDFDWRVNSGTTSSTNTGPDGDNTTGSGNYLYIETSSPVGDGDIFDVISPCIDVTGTTNPTMSFAYHMYGADINQLQVWISHSMGLDSILSIVGEKQTDNSDPYLIQEVDLSGYTGIINVVFRGLGGPSFDADIAIDDVKFFERLANDMAGLSISAPDPGCGLGMEALTITGVNVGTDSVFGFNASFDIGAGFVTEMVSDTVAPGDTVSYTFTAMADFSAVGDYTITGIVSATMPVADQEPANDTTSSSMTVNAPIVSTYPYFEQFENGSGGWQTYGNTTFELGTPANTVINSAASGVNSWVTNLTGLYNTNEDGGVIGPCFDMTNAPAGAWVGMSVWWESEFSWDGAVLQTSVDTGATWQNVGAFGAPNNWYTDDAIDGEPGGQEEGWTGRDGDGSDMWVTAAHPLDPSLIGNPYVLMRVAFGSDGSVTDEGFGFDNIGIGVPPVVNLGPDSVFCNNTVLSSGVSGAATYIWSTGDSTETITLVNNTGVLFKDSIVTLTVVDSIGLVGRDTILLGISATIPSISALMVTDSVACNGDSTANLTAMTMGGSGMVDFTWTSASGDSLSSMLDLMAVPAGTYSFTAVDSLGCIATDMVTVTEPTPVAVALDSLIDNTCPDDMAGEIQITVSGGTAPYTFMWDNGDMTEDLTGLAIGDYTGTITDDNECVLVSPTLSIAATDSLPTAALTADTPSGGTQNFTNGSVNGTTFTWNFGDGSADTVISDLSVAYEYAANGMYTVTL
ncbi:MAG: choice-of-anchor J domain-containing protein, partial [Bacteroidota bacterium]